MLKKKIRSQKRNPSLESVSLPLKSSSGSEGHKIARQCYSELACQHRNACAASEQILEEQVDRVDADFDSRPNSKFHN